MQTLSPQGGTDPAKYHHGQLRNSLIRSAAERLCTQEVREVSLRDLAKALGVSTAAPYSHFKGRQELLEAVADEGFILLRDALEAAIGAAQPGRWQITAILRCFLEFSAKHSGYYKVMFDSSASREHQRPGRTNAADEALRHVSTAIQAASPRLTLEQVRERAILLCAVLHGLISLDRTGPFDPLAGRAAMEKLAIEAGLRLVA